MGKLIELHTSCDYMPKFHNKLEIINSDQIVRIGTTVEGVTYIETVNDYERDVTEYIESIDEIREMLKDV